MQTGKLINGISNRLRRRSQVVQKRIGISGAQGNVLDYILVESENHPVYQKEIEKEFERVGKSFQKMEDFFSYKLERTDIDKYKAGESSNRAVFTYFKQFIFFKINGEICKYKTKKE